MWCRLPPRNASKRSTRIWTSARRFVLPHGTWRDAEASQQPIVLTVSDHNPNGATVRFLVDGALMPQDASAYERWCSFLDGEDPDALDAARARWTQGKSAGF